MNPKKPARQAFVSFVSASTALLSEVVFAAPNAKVDVGAGMEFHSNAALVSTDEKSDVARIAHLGFSWSDPAGPMAGDIGYQVERRDFADNTQQDETAINGRANLRWDLAPRTFDVTLQNSVSQTQASQTTANTANNRERRTVLTAGVDGYLHLSSVDSIVLSPRYTDTTFSESTQSDSRNMNADLSWQHELDAVSKLSVSANSGRVRFDQSQQDYDANSGKVSYQAALARFNYSLSGGYKQFKRDYGQDVSGNTASLAADYRGDGYDVGGTVVRDLTDSSIGLAQSEFSLANFTANDTNINQVDVLETTQVDIFWHQKLSPVSGLNVGMGASQDNYKTTLQDQNRYHIQADYHYKATAYLDFGLQARFAQTRFLDDPQDRKYDDMTYAASVQYLFNPRLDVKFSLSRDSRNANTSTADYTDNIALLSVNYRLY